MVSQRLEEFKSLLVVGKLIYVDTQSASARQDLESVDEVKAAELVSRVDSEISQRI